MLKHCEVQDFCKVVSTKEVADSITVMLETTSHFSASFYKGNIFQVTQLEKLDTTIYHYWHPLSLPQCRKMLFKAVYLGKRNIRGCLLSLFYWNLCSKLYFLTQQNSQHEATNAKIVPVLHDTWNWRFAHNPIYDPSLPTGCVFLFLLVQVT